MKSEILCLIILLGLGALPAQASTVDNLLERYKSEGASDFNAEHGKTMWFTKHAQKKSGKQVDCTACHSLDLSKQGRHVRTGKLIEPLAPSANAERFTDAAKIEKWFKRNCKWTWGRECSPQEKGDLLTFLRTQ
ncbi:MAG: DUF1924 domain-containing protein [Mariprofundaceae bacterium]